MVKFILGLGAYVAALPVTILVLWLAVMFSMYLVKFIAMVLAGSLPVMAIGGVVIFVASMWERMR